MSDDPRLRAEAAQAEARWEDAAGYFEVALEAEQSGHLLDGLGRALWWLGRVDEAVATREEAYAQFMAEGETVRAARTALWLANEYDAAFGKGAVANGWLERAASLLQDEEPSAAHGWLALARAGRAAVPASMQHLADEALAAARKWSDSSLEARALARLATSLVAGGDVEAGLSRFDEAMIVATGEREVSLEAIGETYCDGFAILELIGDVGRLDQWSSVIMKYMGEHAYLPLVAFCGACCGQLFARSGDMDGAERELRRALDTLEATTGRARCVHPAAKLAQLRLMQGRDEEASRLLSGYEGLPETAITEAQIALGKGMPQVAARLMERRLESIGYRGLLAVPYLALLTEARLAAGAIDGAREAAQALQAIADESGLTKVEGEAERATGLVALAAGDGNGIRRLEQALDHFVREGLVIDAAKVRMQLAGAQRDENTEIAVFEARAALEAFEQVGARHGAAAAARLLRELGASAPPGPKRRQTITRREEEVLDLLGEGLTNREIAERLYISPKTVGHHVSRVLTKLGLRNRSEAAAYAVRTRD